MTAYTASQVERVAAVGVLIRSTRRRQPASETTAIMTEIISQYEAERRFRLEQQPRFVSLTTVQPARLLKRGNPFGEVSKVTFQVSGILCIRYGQARRNRLRKLGQTRAAQAFRPQPRQWGQQVIDTPLISYVPTGTGQCLFYLAMNVAGTRGIRWFQNESGMELAEDQVSPFFRSGYDDVITYRNFRLDHIASIRINKQTWNIRPAWDDLQAFLTVDAEDAQAVPRQVGTLF